MTDHAKLSPSARHRWAACPGSVREEARYPEPPAGPAAIEGTHSHTLLEYCLKISGLGGPMHMVGHEMKDHEGVFRVTQDQAKRVEVAVEYIRSRIKEAQDAGLPYELLSETRVNPEWLTGRGDLHGTADVQFWAGDVYEMIDYKDGMGIVEVKDNPQLEQYGLGVLSRFKLQPGESYPFTKFRFTIVQPKLALKGMPVITSVEITVDELLAKIPVIQAEAAATEDLNAPLVPGDKQCKFCKHKGACSALAATATEAIGLMFQPINPSNYIPPSIEIPSFLQSLTPVVPEVLPPAPELSQQAADKDPTRMSDDQLRQALDALPLLRQFIEGVEAEALRRMQAGQTVPGYKLVRGRGSRKWTLPDTEMVEVLKKMGVPKDAIFETKIISPAKVEKLTWEKKSKGEVVQAKLGDRQIKTLETEYIAKSSGALTIAPENDSREAVVTNAAPMFQPIEQPVVQSAGDLPAWLR